MIETALIGRGDQHRLIGVPAGGSHTPASELTLAEGGHFRMEGRAVRGSIQRGCRPPSAGCWSGRGCRRSDPALRSAPGQRRDAAEVWPELGLPNAALHLTVDQHANTGAASIAVTLDTVHRRGALGQGRSGAAGRVRRRHEHPFCGAAALGAGPADRTAGGAGVRRGRPGGGAPGVLGLLSSANSDAQRAARRSPRGPLHRADDGPVKGP